MTRITKDPEERKSEILDAAQELFVEKGYDKTSVNDIVDKVGVAKGLFYYYFKCKDEILNAISERFLAFFMRGIKKVVNDPGLNAEQKIHGIIEEMYDIFGLNKKNGILRLANHLHKEENSSIHRKMSLETVKQMTPLITEVVKQGIREGLFNTSYPEEVTETLLMWSVMTHNGLTFPIEDTDAFMRKAEAIGDIVERVLGARKGSMQFTKYAGWIINGK